MKNKKFNTLIVLFVIGVIAGYFWSKGEQAEQIFTQPIEEKTSEVVIAPNKKKLGRSESDPAPTEHELLKIIAGIPKAKAMYEVGKASNLDVEFYGRVLDQHGFPVAGAKVGVGLLRWRILDAGGEHHDFTTDSEGYFVIDGISGIRFNIRNIEKEGYETQGIKTFSAANPPKTSKDSPYIFHAWKKTEAEPLIYSDGFFGFYDSGEPYTIDIQRELKHKGIVGGDLIIVMHRSASGSRHEPSDWSVDIRSIDGGLIETTDTFMNEAPEGGYVNSWNISRNKGEQNFSSELARKFYLKSRGGVYSKLHVRFLPYYKDEVGVVEVLAWINPNGSRNLQYDPFKRIYPK